MAAGIGNRVRVMGRIIILSCWMTAGDGIRVVARILSLRCRTATGIGNLVGTFVLYSPRRASVVSGKSHVAHKTRSLRELIHS